MHTTRDALTVSYVTVGWSAAQGAAAIVEGLHSRSLALVGVGAALALDMTSSLVLIWRFRHVHGHLGPELLAQRVARIALAAVGLGLIAGAAQRLASHSAPAVDALSLGLAVLGVVILPVLATWKLRVAAGVASPALRTDAHITAVGGAMSAVTLIGLALTKSLHWRWADSVAALVIAALALRQSWSAHPASTPSG